MLSLLGPLHAFIATSPFFIRLKEIVKIGLSTAADGVDTQLAEASQSAALEWVGLGRPQNGQFYLENDDQRMQTLRFQHPWGWEK